MQVSRHVKRSIAYTLGLTLLAGCQSVPSSTLAPATVAPSHLAATAAKPPAEWKVATVGGATQYLVEFSGDEIPGSFEKDLSKAGGTLSTRFDGAGLATVLSSDPNFLKKAGKISGVSSVIEDYEIDWSQDDLTFAAPADGMDDAQAGSAITYGAQQWGLRTIQAPEAWNQGATGEGVTVAVLDSGIDYTNPEFAGQLHPASRSFIEGDGPNADNFDVMDLRGHGSHVAGIIAAKADGKGVTGVAPHAKILALKVNNYKGVSNFDTVIKGIYYASMNGADVINMSFGGTFAVGNPRGEELNRKMGRAVRFAFRRGAVVVSSAGNSMRNFDSTTDFLLPAMLDHNIGVSATGPSTGTDYDSFASFYSNYGKRLVDLSAPGGGVIIKNGQMSSAGFIYSTWSTKAVKQTVDGMPFQPAPYFTLAGTSMAAPHVAGVAALVISKRGHFRAQPKQVLETLYGTADDLGSAGYDAYFGEGRVNAFKAVSATKEHPGQGWRNTVRFW